MPQHTALLYIKNINLIETQRKEDKTMEFNAINGVILIEEVCKFPIALLIVILVIYITGFLVTKNIGTKKETSWLDIIILIRV